MKYLLYISFILISLSFSLIEGNEVENILNKFQKEYAKKNISMEFEMYYLTHSNTKEEIEKGLIQIGEKSYFLKRNEFIDFYDPSYSISINNSYKTISVSRSSHSFNIEKQFQSDSILSSINTFPANYKESKNHYEITTNNDYYECTYFFTKAKCHLARIIYSFNEDDENKSFNVIFKKISTGLPKDKIHNSHKEFIKVKRKGITGIKAYSNYTIKTF